MKAIWPKIRFTVAVLAVMAGFTLVRTLVAAIAYSKYGFENSRLVDNQLCEVQGYHDGTNLVTRLSCLVSEGDKNDVSWVEEGNLVIVIRDRNPDRQDEVSGSTHENRHVFVRYLSGSNSGRNGFIQRFKIKPIGIKSWDS